VLALNYMKVQRLCYKSSSSVVTVWMYVELADPLAELRVGSVGALAVAIPE